MFKWWGAGEFSPCRGGGGGRGFPHQDHLWQQVLDGQAHPQELLHAGQAATQVYLWPQVQQVAWTPEIWWRKKSQGMPFFNMVCQCQLYIERTRGWGFCVYCCILCSLMSLWLTCVDSYGIQMFYRCTLLM